MAEIPDVSKETVEDALPEVVAPISEATTRTARRTLHLPTFFGPLVALAVLIIALSILSSSFLTLTNFFNIGQQVAVLAVCACGGTMVIILGGIDLSVGSVLGLAGAVVGWCFVVGGMPIWLACIVALLAGLAAGTINGTMVVAGRLPPFIATLAMMSVARGLTMVIEGGKPISGYPQGFRNLASFYFFHYIPSPIVIIIVLYALGIMFFRWVPAGRSLFAMGANYEVARLSGLPVKRLTMSVYMAAGLLAGIAGILTTSRLNSASPQAGTGMELDVIAAVVIGGASLAGGYGSLLGTIVGVAIIGVLRNGLTLLNVSSFWQQVVIGVVIALAVLTENLRRRQGVRKA